MPTPRICLPPLVPLVLFFALGPTRSAQARPDRQCRRAVQNRIAWDYQGNRRWQPNNLDRLCRGGRGAEPARCFERVMHRGISWGKSTRWEWKNALDLCAGTRSAEGTIRCFERKRGRGWRRAIDRCRDNRWDRGVRPATATPRTNLTPRRGFGGLRPGTVSLRSDTGNFLARCRGCQETVGGGPDTATIHVDDDRPRYARFQLELLGNGKVAFRSDNGNYLARCRGCIPGAPADTVTIHVPGRGRPPTYAQFTPVQMDNGRYAFRADTGKFVARCRGCSPSSTLPDTVTIHATNPDAAYAQWWVVYH